MTAISPLMTPHRLEPPPRRRFLRLLVKLLIVLVVMAVGGIGVFLSNHQPLHRASFGRSAGACTEEFGEFTSYQGDTISIWDMTCRRKGDAVSWGLSFENKGPIGLKIVGLTPPPGMHLDVATAWVARITNHYPKGAELKPFAPFVAEPGVSYAIEFRTTLQFDCLPASAEGTSGVVSGGAGAARFSYKLGPFTRHDRLLMTPQLRTECGTR